MKWMLPVVAVVAGSLTMMACHNQPVQRVEIPSATDPASYEPQAYPKPMPPTGYDPNMVPQSPPPPAPPRMPGM